MVIQKARIFKGFTMRFLSQRRILGDFTPDPPRGAAPVPRGYSLSPFMCRENKKGALEISSNEISQLYLTSGFCDMPLSRQFKDTEGFCISCISTYEQGLFSGKEYP